MRRFKGFTLTELMIALAVIGIIVAIVTPAIVRTRPNKNRMMIKKTYYTVENIVSSLINDERLYPDKTDDCYIVPMGAGCRWGFDDTEKVNYEGVEYEGDTKFLGLFKSKLNVKRDIAGSDGKAFLTADGVAWDVSGKWDVGKSKVGTFALEADGAGATQIFVAVEGEKSREGASGSIPCTAGSEDCNFYSILILANGKMGIHPTYTKAIEAIEVNTSLKN